MSCICYWYYCCCLGITLETGSCICMYLRKRRDVCFNFFLILNSELGCWSVIGNSITYCSKLFREFCCDSSQKFSGQSRVDSFRSNGVYRCETWNLTSQSIKTTQFRKIIPMARTRRKHDAADGISRIKKNSLHIYWEMLRWILLYFVCFIINYCCQQSTSDTVCVYTK